MNLHIENLSFKGRLNKIVRIAQRVKGTRLTSGTAVVISVFKNKQIINVYNDIESRFLTRI
jgi:hypothetical protein